METQTPSNHQITGECVLCLKNLYNWDTCQQDLSLTTVSSVPIFVAHSFHCVYSQSETKHLCPENKQHD